MLAAGGTESEGHFVLNQQHVTEPQEHCKIEHCVQTQADVVRACTPFADAVSAVAD